MHTSFEARLSRHYAGVRDRLMHPRNAKCERVALLEAKKAIPTPEQPPIDEYDAFIRLRCRFLRVSYPGIMAEHMCARTRKLRDQIVMEVKDRWPELRGKELAHMFHRSPKTISNAMKRLKRSGPPVMPVYPVREDADAHVWSWRGYLAGIGEITSVTDYLKVRCRMIGVSYEGITSPSGTNKSKSKKFTGPRQMLMAEVHRRFPDLSLKQIANRFGGRDHTTVLHALVKHGHVVKPVGRKVTPEMVQEMSDLSNAGMSARGISTKIGVHVSTVRVYLKARAA